MSKRFARMAFLYQPALFMEIGDIGSVRLKVL